jgi:hypothetical protein
MRGVTARVFTSAAVLVGLAGATTLASPVYAAGSVIDVGATIRDGGLIKGSGSWTNNGDWTSACVRIYSFTSPPSGPDRQESIACRTGRGSEEWSAPDVPFANPPFGWCYGWRTKITAYLNGNAKTSKVSNTYWACR